ncbi:MAG: hypothetical protein Q9216_003540 [Gyalolechia sp. 2 TL-2023]
MSSTRLRKRFHYASGDDSDDELPHELDEEEQENLITQLKKEDQERNIMFRRIFMALPLFSALTFMPALIASPSGQVQLSSFLAISSLSCTGYVLISSPTTDETREKISSTTSRPPAPLRAYIDYLNGALSLLVGLNALSFKDNKGVDKGFRLLCMLPSVVFLVTLIARHTMRSVDIGGLEMLKYPYKGA